MTDTGPIWLTESDIAKLVTLNEGIDALRSLLASEEPGKTWSMDKALAAWEPSSSMHSLGSVDALQNFSGVKSWINTPQGARAIFTLFDSKAGDVLALMEANTLGSIRTAGIAGLATDLLTDTSADSLAIFGTGRQARSQIAAVAAVRALRTVYVYGRDEGRRAAFCEKIAAEFPVDVKSMSSVADTAAAAPILTLVTRAREPFLTGKMLTKGTHINAMGSVIPGFAEFTQDVFDQIEHPVVDSIANAQKTSTEFRERFGDDEDEWKAVTPLSAILAGRATISTGSTTLFKGMGMGLSDLAIAIRAYEESLEQGLGNRLQRGALGQLSWSNKTVGHQLEEPSHEATT